MPFLDLCSRGKTKRWIFGCANGNKTITAEKVGSMKQYVFWWLLLNLSGKRALGVQL